jgi:hypothetical protein
MRTEELVCIDNTDRLIGLPPITTTEDSFFFSMVDHLETFLGKKIVAKILMF